MSLILKILTEASQDVKEITIWYRNISRALSLRFVSQLYDGFSQITSFPDAEFNIAPRIKRYRLKKFPYLIFFYKEGGEVIVFAVIHEKRNPKVWKKRIKRK
jgi:toxin ParE2